MKPTVKNLKRKYGVNIESVMNFGMGRRMWRVEYNGEKHLFDNLHQAYEYLKKEEEKCKTTEQ